MCSTLRRTKIRKYIQFGNTRVRFNRVNLCSVHEYDPSNETVSNVLAIPSPKHWFQSLCVLKVYDSRATNHSSLTASTSCPFLRLVAPVKRRVR